MPTKTISILALIAGLVLLAGCEVEEEPLTYTFVSMWGEQGSEPGAFHEPIGIAISGDEVFVSDAQNSRIQVFDREGGFLREFGGDGDENGLNRPMHVDIHEDVLYVSDFARDRVNLFSLEGELLGEVGASGLGEGEFDSPGAVAVDADGRLHVVDFYGHRVQRLDRDGSLLEQWGTAGEPGMEEGLFMYPTDVTLLPDGGFIVGDAYNHRVQAFDGDGNLRWVVPADGPEEGSGEGRFNVATAVTVGPAGEIFVVDFYNHRLQQFDADGTFVQAFGEGGSGEGQFERPTAAAFDDEGYLYVVDHGNNRIQKFAPQQ